MRRFFAAIGRAVAAYLIRPSRWLLERSADGLGWVARLVAAPFAGGGAADVPQTVEDDQAAQAAAKDERSDADNEAARAEVDAVATSLRRCAIARVEGRELPPEDAAHLPSVVCKWIRGLTKPEATVLASGGVDGMRIRRLIVGSGYEKLPKGVRGIESVLEADRSHHLSPEERKAATLAERIRARRQTAPAMRAA